MPDTVAKRSKITVEVGLNDQKMPVEMRWAASDDPDGRTPQPVKGMLLALFSEEHKETLKIDLWTKDMQIREMDRFMYQTLRGLAETYYKATQNQELANAMQQFVYYFGVESEIIPKPEGE